NFQDSRFYSPQTKKMVADLGFDLDELRTKMNPDWPLSNPALPMGMYTDSEHFGEDAIVNGQWLTAWHGVGNYRELVEALNIPASEKEKLIQFIEGTLKLEQPLPTDDMRNFLKKTPYKTFLTDYVGLDDNSYKLFNPFMNVTYGVGVDSLSIYEGLKSGLPGVSVLGQGAIDVLAEAEMLQESDILWMPDGNASLTRQMVRRLIPDVAPGQTMADVVDAQFDYSKLDKPDHPVRLRLNSSAVNVVNNPDESVTVSYVTEGEAFRVKGKHSVLACYNGLIPHLCPELPEAQKENLKYGVKLPLISVNVLARNGKAFRDAGSQLYLCPTSYFKMVSNAPPVSIGGYEFDEDPDAPMIIYLLTTPTQENDGKQTARDLYRLARYQVYTTSFEQFEEQIRKQLNGMFGATGFDADRDIEAITVNRWSHGYAYQYRGLFDPEWPEGEAPHELGRRQFGRISIANSDAEATAYLNGAIDAAYRAVNEQLAG
ncbi:MAG: NAD(P)/FAD-dependent oxidoreductase, partial [Pseudomonadota bacterium]